MPKRSYAVIAATLAFLLLLPALLNGCASLPLDYPRPVSFALLLPEKTDMGKRIQAHVARHQGKSGFYLLPSGEGAFLERVRAIDQAERTLDLQYYIFNDDLTGKFLMDRLLAAAERGVRVRLLLDGWTNAVKPDWALAMFQTNPNIEVRVFNPFGGLRSSIFSRVFQAVFVAKRLRARMHNKIFIADNSLAIVGGRNIGNEYFGARSESTFGDLDIMAIGPITRKISDGFDDYWNCPLAIPIQALEKRQPSAAETEEFRRYLAENRKSMQNSEYAQKLKEAELTKRVEAGYVPYVWAKGEVLIDDPLKVIRPEPPNSITGQKLKTIMDQAQSEVLIISAYFIPGKRGIQFFKQLRERGITVKILTNSLASTDVPIAEGGYAHYRKALLEMGVGLYELKPNPDRYRFWERIGLGSSSRGTLHAKTVIIDRKVVFVGSFNLDPRSERLNTEDGIVVRSAELGAQATRLFDQGISPSNSYRLAILGESPVSEEWHGLVWITEENGREVHYYHDPMTDFWRRFEVRFLVLFAPKSDL
ncbi:MAG: phospholipase D family protein [Desulfobaccales bacterium]|jgi:putative cardiolipin synthase